MADWTTPKTWSVGDILTASDMNTYVRDNTPIFYWVTSTYSVTNQNVDIDMLQSNITLAASVLGTNRRATVWLAGTITGTAHDITSAAFKFKLGSTTVFDTPVTGSLAQNAANRAYVFRWTIQNMNSASSQQHSLEQAIAKPSNFTTGTGCFDTLAEAGVGVTSTSVSTGSSQSLTFLWKSGQAAADVGCALNMAKIAVGV